jgi:hypothetical protein
VSHHSNLLRFIWMAWFRFSALALGWSSIRSIVVIRRRNAEMKRLNDRKLREIVPNGVAQTNFERLVKLAKFCCRVFVFGGRNEENKRLNEPYLLDLCSMLEWCGSKFTQVAFTKLRLKLTRMKNHCRRTFV